MFADAFARPATVSIIYSTGAPMRLSDLLSPEALSYGRENNTHLVGHLPIEWGIS